MADQYNSFAELQVGETEGVDYRICVKERESDVAIIAPHGGWIEPGTSEIAATIAGNTHSLYCFEGLRKRPHEELHIDSRRFDEPQCRNLIGRCRVVLAVHGLFGPERRVDVGGRDTPLRDAISASLKSEGFSSKIVVSGSHAAISPENICNKGSGRKGVQLEITRGLRDALLNSKEQLLVFAKSVQQAIS